MNIATNVPALNSHRSLTAVSSQQARVKQRLSSGFRINVAADDAAGLGISQKMRAQIRGLTQASRNVQDGISLIQTAEGGMQQISSILIRKRELIIQALNDTNTDEDRMRIQHEISHLIQEIDSIAEKTEFNTIKLLNGGGFVIDPGMGGTGGIRRAYFEQAYLDNPGLMPINPDGSVNLWVMNANGGLFSLGSSKLRAVAITTEGTHILDGIFYDHFSSQSVVWPRTPPTGPNFNANGEMYFTSTFIITESQFDGGPGAPIPAHFFGLNMVQTITIMQDSDGREFFEVRYRVSNLHRTGDLNPAAVPPPVQHITFYHFGQTWEVDFTGNTHPGFPSFVEWSNRYLIHRVDFTPSRPGLRQGFQQVPQLWIHSGANSGQGLLIELFDCRTKRLGIMDISVLTKPQSNAGLFMIDNAINIINGYRARAGAIQNRLEHTMRYLDLNAENLSASESRIRDADMAKEMMGYVKLNTMGQAALSVLTQANQSPQNVLHLLG